MYIYNICRVDRIAKSTYTCTSFCYLVKPCLLPVLKHGKCHSPFTGHHSFPESAGAKGQAKK